LVTIYLVMSSKTPDLISECWQWAFSVPGCNDSIICHYSNNKCMQLKSCLSTHAQIISSASASKL